ncbi:hypothetical protein E2C01_006325 [Portunus trituberculatus]|uniref:Uncharacterized protein n=1 Tax=Portunus trituberculatus TaxID=210409 RepID=A0A5B7CUS7_PORTR|nr:hypothetical protein [Portunus trituberculatus]
MDFDATTSPVCVGEVQLNLAAMKTLTLTLTTPTHNSSRETASKIERGIIATSSSDPRHADSLRQVSYEILEMRDC